jgi:glyoxylase-like metal-dependent hydrolase (beta-lactamase superfamily II)
MTIQCTIVPVTPYQQNCSIIKCESTGKAAIVDPGGDVERILAAVEQMQASVEKIILTHANLDHCAGHTPGHIVFLYEPQKVAWVGDVLFQGSIGRTDFPRGNHQELIASIREKLFPLGDDITFIPGHGPTSTFGYERENNPFVADSCYG